jgi:hypothetical protein
MKLWKPLTESSLREWRDLFDRQKVFREERSLSAWALWRVLSHDHLLPTSCIDYLDGKSIPSGDEKTIGGELRRRLKDFLREDDPCVLLSPSQKVSEWFYYLDRKVAYENRLMGVYLKPCEAETSQVRSSMITKSCEAVALVIERDESKSSPEMDERTKSFVLQELMSRDLGPIQNVVFAHCYLL